MPGRHAAAADAACASGAAGSASSATLRGAIRLATLHSLQRWWALPLPGAALQVLPPPPPPPPPPRAKPGLLISGRVAFPAYHQGVWLPHSPLSCFPAACTVTDHAQVLVRPNCMSPSPFFLGGGGWGGCGRAEVLQPPGQQTGRAACAGGPGAGLPCRRAPGQWPVGLGEVCLPDLAARSEVSSAALLVKEPAGANCGRQAAEQPYPAGMSHGIPQVLGQLSSINARAQAQMGQQWHPQPGRPSLASLCSRDESAGLRCR